MRSDPVLDVDADSVDVVELVMAVEEKAGFPFNEDDLEVVDARVVLESGTVGAFIQSLFLGRSAS